MTTSTLVTNQALPSDSAVWHSLKQAITSSSGFQRWQQEHHSLPQVKAEKLDLQVRRYLRETLETLAY